MKRKSSTAKPDLVNTLTVNMSKLAIVGSRSFDDYNLLVSNIDSFIRNLKNDKNVRISCIVSGGARGADKLARRYASDRHLQIIEYLPKWKRDDRTNDRSAALVRNRLIVDNADYIFAFWDGKSPGTRSTISYAKKIGKPVSLCKFNEGRND